MFIVVCFILVNDCLEIFHVRQNVFKFSGCVLRSLLIICLFLVLYVQLVLHLFPFSLLFLNISFFIKFIFESITILVASIM